MRTSIGRGPSASFRDQFSAANDLRANVEANSVIFSGALTSHGDLTAISFPSKSRKINSAFADLGRSPSKGLCQDRVLTKEYQKLSSVEELMNFLASVASWRTVLPFILISS
jgi:hypothetical protein